MICGLCDKPVAEGFSFILCADCLKDAYGLKSNEQIHARAKRARAGFRSKNPVNPYAIAADAIDALLRIPRDHPLCPMGPTATAALRPIWEAGLSLGEIESLLRGAAEVIDPVQREYNAERSGTDESER